MSYEAPKPVILTFVNWYLPGFLGGGPIRSIANMVERLGDEFDFHIVTNDHDFGSNESYSTVLINKWNAVGKAKVFYADKSTLSLTGIANLLRDTPHDILYLNSFFDINFSLKPMIINRMRGVQCRATIIAPRGEFSIGAFKLKAWKKLPFTLVMRLLGLYKKITWHASTILEVNDIKKIMGIREDACCRIAPNVTEIQNYHELRMLSSFVDNIKTGTKEAPLNICFLSRISPKKNLDYALKILCDATVHVNFDIFGPREDEVYWDRCQQLINTLPPHVHVSYAGVVKHTDVRVVISKYDLFFLPTRGENFGHVFLEAWSAGVPVLVSDQTPWCGLTKQSLGWDIPLARPDLYAHALNTIAGLDQTKRIEMKMSCINFAQKITENEDSLLLNRKLFLAPLS